MGETLYRRPAIIFRWGRLCFDTESPRGEISYQSRGDSVSGETLFRDTGAQTSGAQTAVRPNGGAQTAAPKRPAPPCPCPGSCGSGPCPYPCPCCLVLARTCFHYSIIPIYSHIIVCQCRQLVLIILTYVFPAVILLCDYKYDAYGLAMFFCYNYRYYKAYNIYGYNTSLVFHLESSNENLK